MDTSSPCYPFTSSPLALQQQPVGGLADPREMQQEGERIGRFGDCSESVIGACIEVPSTSMFTSGWTNGRPTDRANVFSFPAREGYMWGGRAYCSISGRRVPNAKPSRIGVRRPDALG
jgi:hypothetical protein